MKVHIEKEKVENKGCFGNGKTWFTIHARYELNEEEKQLLVKNKHVLDIYAFDYPFRGPDGVPSGESPTFKKMIGEKDIIIGCVFSNAELEKVEGIINGGAKNLKAELYRSGTGSSTTEI